MDHLCSSGSVADCRFQDAPFADERNRYLSHCAARGARLAVLKVKRNELRWIARRLGPDADRGVGMTELMPLALERQNLHGAATGARRVIDIGRPWLRFLGWWREPAVPFLDRGQLDRYVTWMRDERGFTPSTVEQWGRTTRRFLRWCAEAGRQLGDLTAGDIDNYVATQGKGRWTRVSTANMVSALRAFLRYAAKEGLVANRGKSDAVFLNRSNQPLTRFGIHRLVTQYAERASCFVFLGDHRREIRGSGLNFSAAAGDPRGNPSQRLQRTDRARGWSDRR